MGTGSQIVKQGRTRGVENPLWAAGDSAIPPCFAPILYLRSPPAARLTVEIEGRWHVVSVGANVAAVQVAVTCSVFRFCPPEQPPDPVLAVLRGSADYRIVRGTMFHEGRDGGHVPVNEAAHVQMLSSIRRGHGVGALVHSGRHLAQGPDLGAAASVVPRAARRPGQAMQSPRFPGQRRSRQRGVLNREQRPHRASHAPVSYLMASGGWYDIGGMGNGAW